MIAEKVRDIYEKSRIPIAYILVVTALGLRFLPVPLDHYAFHVLIILFFFLLPFVFEIHKAVSSKVVAAPSFKSFIDATQDIKKSLDDYFSTTKNPSVFVLGIFLYYQWPMLNAYLIGILSGPNPPLRLSIEIAMMDYEYIKAIDGKDARSAQALSSISSIKEFLDQYEEKISKYEWSINVWTFRNIPMLWGILIGESKLFLGRSYWDKTYVRGGANPIERFSSNDEFLGKEKINEFYSWFQFLKQEKLNLHK